MPSHLPPLTLRAFIVYAPPAPPSGPGACGIVSAPLGYLQTFGTPVPTDVEVRLYGLQLAAGAGAVRHGGSVSNL